MIDVQVSEESLLHVVPKTIPAIDLVIIHVIIHVTDDLIDVIVVIAKVALLHEIAVEVVHRLLDVINAEETDVLHRHHRDVGIGEVEAHGIKEMSQLGIMTIGMVLTNHNHEMMIWLSMDSRVVVVNRDHRWTPLNTTRKNGPDLMEEHHMVLNVSVVLMLRH